MTGFFPIPRSYRSDDMALSQGETETSARDWRVFDGEDLRVLWRPDGSEDLFVELPASAYTVTPAAPETDWPAFPIVVINEPFDDDVTLRIRGARLYERQSSVTQGNVIKSTALEREFGRIALTLQEIRRDLDSVGDIEEARDATFDARDDAQDAQAAAESAAGASLSNADSRAAVQSTNIPAPVNYIRTAGYATAGDGGGALLKPRDGGPLYVTSADGREWELASNVVAAEAFGGSAADLRAYLLENAPGEPDFRVAPAYLAMTSRLFSDIADGLPITPLHFDAQGDNSTDDRAAIQDAVDFVLANQLIVHGLDFVGRRYRISAPIVWSTVANANGGVFKKKFCNGWIQARSNWTGGGYLFDLTGMTNNLNKVTFDALTLQGGEQGSVPLADGALDMDKTQGVWVTGSTLEFFNGAAIRDNNTGAGAEVYVIGNRISGGGLATNPVGIDLYGNDNAIFNNLIRECNNHIRLRNGTNWVMGNHLYNFTRSKNIDGILCDFGKRQFIIGNYIDGCWLEIIDPEACIVNNNNFLLQDGADWTATESNRAFIELVPSTTGFTVNKLEIMGNHFRCVTGGPVNLVRANGRLAGNITAGFTSSRIKDNICENVNEQATHYQRVESISAATSVVADFAPQSISGQNMQFAQATFMGPSGGPINRIARSGGQFTAHLGTSSTGTVLFNATMNADGV